MYHHFVLFLPITNFRCFWRPADLYKVSVNAICIVFADRRNVISRRHSMERMELMKLTPDKKGDGVNNHGGARPKIPKVQKSMTVATDTIIPNSQSHGMEVYLEKCYRILARCKQIL